MNELSKDDLSIWHYPGGEVGVRVKPNTDRFLTWRIQNSNDLVALIMASNARPEGPFTQLILPYFPYARQDRRAVEGDPDAVYVVAQMLATGGFKTIWSMDPHSEAVGMAVHAAGMIFQPMLPYDLFVKYLQRVTKPDECIYIISPDKGATEKTKKYAQFAGSRKVQAIVQCDKVRNSETGKLLGFKVVNVDYFGDKSIAPSQFIIVDDICDGGRTFLGVKEAVSEHLSAHDKPFHLWTTHGIYSAGLDVLAKEFKTLGSSNSFLHGKQHKQLITIASEQF